MIQITCLFCVLCRRAGTELVRLAAKVLDPKVLSSIKIHFIVEHAHRDILSHGNPYNHDAQGSH